MKNTCRVDFANSKIIMDRTFAKKCENPSSDEYAQLQRVRADYPNFTVVRKQIKRNDDKECYKGLTYAYMERYIALRDDKEGTIRKAYDEMRLISECHSIRYPVIKKWFLKQFPEVAKFGVTNQEEENKDNSPNVTPLSVRTNEPRTTTDSISA